MADLEYDRWAIIGEVPYNLHPRFRYEQDGSTAAQLTAAGFYSGIIAAKSAIEEAFVDQPDVLQRLNEVFLVQTDAPRSEATVFPAAVRGVNKFRGSKEPR